MIETSQGSSFSLLFFENHITNKMRDHRQGVDQKNIGRYTPLQNMEIINW